jgi:polar amino acid transport system substrate-binding protein
MAELHDTGRLRVGVPEDRPPIGYVDASGAPRGMAVELGRIVAEALRVEPEFVAYPSDRLLGLVAIGGLDLAFPVTPLTEELVRAHSFTDPYIVDHQRLLVPAGSGWRDLDDLTGARVCSHTHPLTGVELDELNPGIEVDDAVDPEECRAAFDAGRVDAVTAVEFVLEEILADLRRDGSQARARVAGDELNTVGYGAAVLPVPGLAQFVRDVLEAAKEDGTWERRLDATPPTLTLEEAAALWPMPR